MVEKQVLEIVKQKDDWRISVEISENSKQEPAVTVKVRGDADAKTAGEEALQEYNRIKKEMKA